MRGKIAHSLEWCTRVNLFFTSSSRIYTLVQKVRPHSAFVVSHFVSSFVFRKELGTIPRNVFRPSNCASFFYVSFLNLIPQHFAQNQYNQNCQNPKNYKLNIKKKLARKYLNVWTSSKVGFENKKLLLKYE